LFGKVVVGVSGSNASVHAAKYAIMLAKLYGSSVTAVYVVDTATIRHLQISKIFIEDEAREYERSLRENGERCLAFVEELARSKKVEIKRDMRAGSVYSELLAASEEAGADCVVLGGWEKDRTSFDIISKSHREILFHSKCSVIIVKEPRIEELFAAL
jgi:nucleotide-binding universal stress UspA family protein